MPIHRIETHCHTNLVSPCGQLSPKELAVAYARAGYSAIITTDHLVHSLPLFVGVDSWRKRVHRYFSGYRAVRREAAALGLTVLPGFELTFRSLSGKDFLVYGFDEELLTDAGNVCEMTPSTFRSLADEVGALVFQAHPYRGGEPVDHRYLHGVEVYNGNPRVDSGNDRASAYAARHDLYTLSGSDAHRAEDVGRGGITLPEVPQTIADLVRWYREEPHAVGLLGAEESELALAT